MKDRLGRWTIAISAACMILILGATTPVGAAPPAAISPDGRQIALAWPPTGTADAETTLLNTETGAVEGLQSEQAPLGMAWSPDGAFLLYAVGNPDEPVTYVFDMTKRRSRRIPVKMGPPFAWREDSRRFAGVWKNEDGRTEVVFFGLSEFGETLRAPSAVDAIIGDRMVWLPNTDDVAFIGQVRGLANVRTMEGGQERTITSTGDILTIALSKDGKELIWARSSRNTRYILLSLYAFDLSTRSVRRQEFPERVAGINPRPDTSPTRLISATLCPAGDRLAVVVEYPSSGKTAGTCRLYALRMSGGGARMVRSVPSANAGLTAVWSDDGQRLAVVDRRGSEAYLAVFDSNGSNGKVALHWRRP